MSSKLQTDPMHWLRLAAASKHNSLQESRTFIYIPLFFSIFFKMFLILFKLKCKSFQIICDDALVKVAVEINARSVLIPDVCNKHWLVAHSAYSSDQVWVDVRFRFRFRFLHCRHWVLFNVAIPTTTPSSVGIRVMFTAARARIIFLQEVLIGLLPLFFSGMIGFLQVGNKSRLG